MAHEMKLLLQMVRRVAYQRVVGRIVAEQAGWLAGFGCTDPSLVATSIIKQAQRTGSPLYLLYIDLATMFPRLDREVLTVSETLAGLPREVSELALRIFGHAGDPDSAVQCRYDSEGGLGDSFGNDSGALMGCVLSPDRAKIMLNSIILAIRATCSGVRLWGHGAEDDVDTWRRISQVAFADDWLGFFYSARDIRRGWALWRSWELISG